MPRDAAASSPPQDAYDRIDALLEAAMRFVPVSYTHLDVYKRQGKTFRHTSDHGNDGS